MFYIGVDVGGTTIKAGVVDEGGNILVKDATPTLVERPYQEIIRDLAELCNRVIEMAKVSLEQIAAIGVGIPGIYDVETGIIPFCTNLGWHDVPFEEEMKKYFSFPIYVDNDATVAGYAESVAGVSAGTKSSVFITLGTGVGAGIIINGKPYSGVHGVGSELGHMVVRVDGELCTCGNRGCFERYASATAIIREAKHAMVDHPESMLRLKVGGDPERMTARVVFECAKEKDKTAMAVVREYVRNLAHGIVNIINILDPEVVVLGGGVSNAGDFLLDAVKDAMRPLIFFKTMPYCDVRLAKLGSDAGIIGAALLGKR